MDELSDADDLSDGEIYVGSKPHKKYMKAVSQQLLYNDNVEAVTVKARGKKISKAVDVVQRLQNGYLPQIQGTETRIDTDVIEQEDTTHDVRVSRIEIEVYT